MGLGRHILPYPGYPSFECALPLASISNPPTANEKKREQAKRLRIWGPRRSLESRVTDPQPAHSHPHSHPHPQMAELHKPDASNDKINVLVAVNMFILESIVPCIMLHSSMACCSVALCTSSRTRKRVRVRVRIKNTNINMNRNRNRNMNEDPSTDQNTSEQSYCRVEPE